MRDTEALQLLLHPLHQGTTSRNADQRMRVDEMQRPRQVRSAAIKSRRRFRCASMSGLQHRCYTGARRVGIRRGARAVGPARTHLPRALTVLASRL